VLVDGGCNGDPRRDAGGAGAGLAKRQPLGRGNPAAVLPVFLGCELVDQSKAKRGIINRAAFKKMGARLAIDPPSIVSEIIC